MNYKLKHFIWKCLSKIFPVKEVIRSRIGSGYDKCVYCGEGTETLEHMFFFCKHAGMIWRVTPIKRDGISEFRQNFWL